MAERVLVDTNVAIYLATGHSLAAHYRSYLEGRTPALSFASVAELLYTSRRAADPERAAAYWRATFPYYVLLFPDFQTCGIWAAVTAECHRRGRPRQDNDLWIAATALRYRLPLVTHNRRDFADIVGLQVLTESSEER